MPRRKETNRIHGAKAGRKTLPVFKPDKVVNMGKRRRGRIDNSERRFLGSNTRMVPLIKYLGGNTKHKQFEEAISRRVGQVKRKGPRMVPLIKRDKLLKSKADMVKDIRKRAGQMFKGQMFMDMAAKQAKERLREKTR